MSWNGALGTTGGWVLNTQHAQLDMEMRGCFIYDVAVSAPIIRLRTPSTGVGEHVLNLTLINTEIRDSSHTASLITMEGSGPSQFYLNMLQCRIKGLQVTSTGAPISLTHDNVNSNTSIHLQNNTFVDNSGIAAGLFQLTGGQQWITLMNNNATGNKATQAGGVLLANKIVNATIENNDFASNKAGSGGVMSLDGFYFRMDIYNNRFTQNSAVGKGGVFMATNIARTNMSYNVFESNQAGQQGATLYFVQVAGGTLESIGDIWSRNNCTVFDSAVIDLGTEAVIATFSNATWYSENPTNIYLSAPAGKATLDDHVVQMQEGYKLLTVDELILKTRFNLTLPGPGSLPTSYILFDYTTRLELTELVVNTIGRRGCANWTIGAVSGHANLTSTSYTCPSLKNAAAVVTGTHWLVGETWPWTFMVNVTRGCVFVQSSTIAFKPPRGLHGNDQQTLVTVVEKCGVELEIVSATVDVSSNAAICSATLTGTLNDMIVAYNACPTLLSVLPDTLNNSYEVIGNHYLAANEVIMIQPAGIVYHTDGYLLLEGEVVVQVDSTTVPGNQTLIHSTVHGLQGPAVVSLDNSLNLRLCYAEGITNTSDVVVVIQRCPTLSGYTTLQHSGRVELNVGHWLATDETLSLSSETTIHVTDTVVLEGDMEMRITSTTVVGQQSLIESVNVQGTFAAFAFTSESIRICNSSLVYSATQVGVFHTPCPPIEIPPDSDDPQEIPLTGNRYLPANETLKLSTNQHVIVSAGCVALEGQLVLKIKANSQANSTVTLITSEDGCLEGQFSQIQVDNTNNPSVCIGNSDYSPNAFQIALETCPTDSVSSPGFPVGAIVGIVVGSVALVALVAGLVGWYMLYYKRRVAARAVQHKLQANH